MGTLQNFQTERMREPIIDKVLRDMSKIPGTFLQKLEGVMNFYAYIACSYISMGNFERAKYFSNLFYYTKLLYLKELRNELEKLEERELIVESADRRVREETKVWHS
jgi:hypothetical protein